MTEPITLPPSRQKEEGHSVENGKVLRTSVSAISNFQACPRLWYFEKALHLPGKPPSKGTIRGAEGHGRIEHLLKTGQNVLDPLEQLGVDAGLIPKPDTYSQLVEHRLDFSLGPIPLLGFVDLVEKKPADFSGIRITDWKFTKDINAYGAKAADLVDTSRKEGIQMVGYAAWLEKYLPAWGGEIQVRHVTFQYVGRREVVPTTATLKHGEATAKWMAFAAGVAPKMTAVAAAPSWDKVEGNKSHCDKYGGCHFKSKCFSPTEQVTQLFTKHRGVDLTSSEAKTEPKEKTMGLLSQMKTVVAAPTPAPAPTPAAVAPPLVLPPDAPKSDPALAARVSPVEEKKVLVVRADLEESGISTPASPVQENPEPKKRGRPRKVEQPANALISASARAEVPSGETEPAAPPPGSEKEVPATQSEAPFLYFYAVPMGVKTKSLFEYVEQLDAATQKMGALNLVDLRAATDSVFGYSKWKSYLVKMAASFPLECGHYVVSEQDERIVAVAEYLATMLPPGHVVRGVR